MHFLGETLRHGEVRIRKLRKDHVGTGLCIGLGAADRFIESAANGGHRVGARDNDEIRIAPRVAGGADLAGRLFECDYLLAGDMAAALRTDLVFDVYGGDAGVFKIAHRAHDVDGVAVTGIGIGDDRNVYGTRDVAGVGGHFLAGDETDVGQPKQRQRNVIAAHVDELEAGFLADHGVQRRGDARREMVFAVAHQRAQLFAFAHRGSACVVSGMLTQVIPDFPRPLKAGKCLSCVVRIDRHGCPLRMPRAPRRVRRFVRATDPAIFRRVPGSGRPPRVCRGGESRRRSPYVRRQTAADCRPRAARCSCSW